MDPAKASPPAFCTTNLVPHSFKPLLPVLMNIGGKPPYLLVRMGLAARAALLSSTAAGGGAASLARLGPSSADLPS